MQVHTRKLLSFSKSGLLLGVGLAAALGTSVASADCGVYGRSVAPPPHWDTSPTPSTAPWRDGTILGMWRFTMVSDGTAYPTPVPYNAVVDFGTTQWHPDGTEIMISGGRPPSSGDVCMGVWEHAGPDTYKLKHLALAWVSSDTPPPIGPISPAQYVGPAVIVETVALDASTNSYKGTFTLDQYGADGVTLLEHIAGSVAATRVTAN